MKRIATVLVMLGVVFVVTVPVFGQSSYPGTLTATTDSSTVEPGATFGVLVDGCTGGETVIGEFEGQSDSIACEAPSGTGPEAGTAALSFVAPDEAGIYAGTVVGSESNATTGFTVDVRADASAGDGVDEPGTTDSVARLATTGANIGTTLVIASVMLLAGIGLILVTAIRRRRTT